MVLVSSVCCFEVFRCLEIYPDNVRFMCIYMCLFGMENIGEREKKEKERERESSSWRRRMHGRGLTQDFKKGFWKKITTL